MEIFNKRALDRCADKNAAARSAIQQWIEIVEIAEWKNHNDLKKTFPSADYVGNGRYVFNIKGNGYRVIAIVVFVAGVLTVRFAGTHAEYDKIDSRTF